MTKIDCTRACLLPLLAGAVLLWGGCSKSQTEQEPAAEVQPGVEGSPATQTGGGPGAPESGKQAPSPVAKTPAPSAKPAPPPPLKVTVPEGSALRVRTDTTLSTKTAKGGEAFTGNLAEPLTQDGRVIAAKGSTVKGVVAESDPGGRVKGVASISIRLTALELASGETIELATSTYSQEAKSSKKKDAVKVGIASGVGAAIGAIAGGGRGAAIGAGAGAGAGTGLALATRGDPAVIPSETLMDFKLSSPFTVTIPRR